MSQINYIKVNEYINQLTRKDEFFSEMEKYAENYNVPIISREVGEFIKIIIKMNKVKRILEIGTAIGYSSILMANLDEEINIITLEKNMAMVELAKNNISSAKLDNRISIIQGDALNNLEKLDGEFDMIFIDAAKGHYMEFFQVCEKNMKPGTIIISDNILLKGLVADDSLVRHRKRTMVRRMREYLDYITNDSRYSTSVIPLSDGVALTYREE